jgi:hypothetical protein
VKMTSGMIAEPRFTLQRALRLGRLTAPAGEPN